MDINTLFLVGFALIEFGIIMYLLFKVDDFKKKVKNFLEENLSKDEKILELRSSLIKRQLELQELKVNFKQLVNSKEELTKEKEALEKKSKYLEDEMLRTSVLTKQEDQKVEEKPVDKVVEKLRKKK